MGNDPSVPKEQVIYDFACLYQTNPELWNKVIADVRGKHKPSLDMLKMKPHDDDDDDHHHHHSKGGIRDPSVTGFTDEVVREINKVRSNPPAYVVNLQNRLDSFVDDNVYKLANDEYLRTKEGKALVLETIDVLKATPVLPPMQGSSFLEESAMDHASDLIINNVFSHNGSDGSILKDRIERDDLNRIIMYYALQDFGSNNVTDIIVNLLIDDGVSTRGHRKNILHPDYHYVGAALGPHPDYSFCCVMDFTTKVVAFDQILKKDLTKSLKTMDDLQNEDIVKLFLTVPYTGDLEAEFKEQLQSEAQVLVEFSAAQKSLRISFVQSKKTLTRTLTWA